MMLMLMQEASIWIGHLHRSDRQLVGLLRQSLIACHPMVIGELALGSLSHRIEVLWLLNHLPEVSLASHEEVMTAVERHRMHGRGLGLIDVHLLTSVLITAGAELWTRDTRLRAAAAELGIEYAA